MPSSRGSSQPRDGTRVSFMFPALAGRFSTISTTWEALLPLYLIYNHVISVD